MDQTKTNTTAPQAVSAGTKLALAVLSVITAGSKRDVKVPKGFFNSDTATLDLSDEGAVTFCDVNAKDQAPRKMKLGEHKNALQDTLLWIEPKGGTGKYAAVIACETCKAPVRRFTSDLHQAFHCVVCAIKAKRAKISAKRAAKRAESKG